MGSGMGGSRGWGGRAGRLLRAGEAATGDLRAGDFQSWGCTSGWNRVSRKVPSALERALRQGMPPGLIGRPEGVRGSVFSQAERLCEPAQAALAHVHPEVLIGRSSRSLAPRQVGDRSPSDRGTQSPPPSGTVGITAGHDQARRPPSLPRRRPSPLTMEGIDQWASACLVQTLSCRRRPGPGKSIPLATDPAPRRRRAAPGPPAASPATPTGLLAPLQRSAANCRREPSCRGSCWGKSRSRTEEIAVRQLRLRRDRRVAHLCRENCSASRPQEQRHPRRRIATSEAILAGGALHDAIVRWRAMARQALVSGKLRTRCRSGKRKEMRYAIQSWYVMPHGPMIRRELSWVGDSKDWAFLWLTAPCRPAIGPSVRTASLESLCLDGVVHQEGQ